MLVHNACAHLLVVWLERDALINDDKNTKEFDTTNWKQETHLLATLGQLHTKTTGRGCLSDTSLASDKDPL